MGVFVRRIEVSTKSHEEVIDLTRDVQRIVAQSGVVDGVCTVFVSHATAAIAINENADPNIGKDFLRAMKQLVVDHDKWLHDLVDDNAAAHIKSALVGPSETIPVESGRLALGTWQNVFLCEFDGPRQRRTVIVTVIG